MAKFFSYKAKDITGNIVTGTILADSECTVAMHIREQGYFMTQITEENRTHSLFSCIKNVRSVSLKEVSIFCRLFSTMLHAGLPLVSCLHILIEQTDNPRMKHALQDIYKKVKEGTTLSHALSHHPLLFPSLMSHMVEAGEVVGMLDEILCRLASHFEKEYQMNKKIKSAMTYPGMVSGIATLLVLFILTYVLPIFVQMFANMNKELPLLTRLLLMVSNFIRNFFPFIILATVISGYFIQISYRQERTRMWIDDVLIRIPIIGLLSRKISIARFSRTLGTLLYGGVPIITALEIVRKTLGNLSMVKALAQAQTGIKEGRSLATTLAQSKIFTPMVIQMVAIGEESGALDDMLENIATFYENDVDDMVCRLQSAIEPIVIAALGIVIGLIIIAIMVPFFDIMTNPKVI